MGRFATRAVGDDAGERLRIRACLQQQHLPVRILGEAGRGYASSRAAAYDDDVVVTFLIHCEPPSPIKRMALMSNMGRILPLASFVALFYARLRALERTTATNPGPARFCPRRK